MKITLKAARINKGLSRTEAAKQLGMSICSVTNYEKGNTSPTYETCKKISEVYEIALDDIIF